jgi:hypothetical protein
VSFIGVFSARSNDFSRCVTALAWQLKFAYQHPLLIPHVAGHPDVTAQALWLDAALRAANVTVVMFGAS